MTKVESYYFASVTSLFAKKSPILATRLPEVTTDSKAQKTYIKVVLKTQKTYIKGLQKAENI
jgi:hypothetical protein